MTTLVDQKLAEKEREGYTLLLAMRSWEFEALPPCDAETRHDLIYINPNVPPGAYKPARSPTR